MCEDQIRFSKSGNRCIAQEQFQWSVLHKLTAVAEWFTESSLESQNAFAGQMSYNNQEMVDRAAKCHEF